MSPLGIGSAPSEEAPQPRPVDVHEPERRVVGERGRPAEDELPATWSPASPRTIGHDLSDLVRPAPVAIHNEEWARVSWEGEALEGSLRPVSRPHRKSVVSVGRQLFQGAVRIATVEAVNGGDQDRSAYRLACTRNGSE